MCYQCNGWQNGEIEYEITVTDPIKLDKLLKILWKIYEEIEKKYPNAYEESSYHIIVPCAVQFHDKPFKCKVEIKNCTFDKEVNFSNCAFNKEVDFKNCTFKNKVKIHSVIFKESVKFDNTTFNDLADFWNTTFEKKQQFWKTDFFNIAVFSEVEFRKEVQFVYCPTTEKTAINFIGATFYRAIDISHSNFQNRPLNFWNAKFFKDAREAKKDQSIQDIDEFKIKEEAKKDSLYLYDDPTKKNDPTPEEKKYAYRKLRESFRIIKHSFRSVGNHIEAIKVQSYEMKMYQKEVNVNIGNNKIEWIKNSKEKLLLWLNSISNNYGTSWLHGVGFTFVVALSFFVFILIGVIKWSDCSFPNIICEASNKEAFYYWKEGFSCFIYNFIKLLNIADLKYDSFIILAPNGSVACEIPFGGWMILIIYIARVFIAYGYYQTVQAFRKYKA